MNAKELFCSYLVATTLAAAPASALTWEVIDISLFSVPPDFGTDPRYPRVDQAPRGIKVYIGHGDVEPGDAERLLDLYTGTDGGDRTLGRLGRDGFPEVWLHSPGGDAFAGMRLGLMIRELQLATVVPEGAFCGSACTTAFLGGVERRVEGPFLVHAARPTSPDAELYSAVEGAQYYAASYLDYTRLMIGDVTVAEQAIAFGAGGAKGDAFQLDDAQLRDWGVITVAARRTQNFDPDSLHTIDCSAGTPATVTDLVCGDLTLGRYDARLVAATETLAATPKDLFVLAQHSQWEAVRDGCETRFSGYTPLPFRIDSATGQLLATSEADALSIVTQALLARNRGSGPFAVQACLLDVYSARVRQLETLIAFRDATAAAQLVGWE